MMHIAPTPDLAAEQCAHYVTQLLEDSIAARGRACIAFSGGSSPRRMFAFLRESSVEWNRVDVFQVDERGVPPGHPDSNYSMIEEHLLRSIAVPAAQVHRIEAELDPRQAASHYAATLTDRLGPDPSLDIVVCGVGPDAHTASLFPGDPLVNNRLGLTAATWVEKFAQHRITLLPRVLLHARNVIVLATGADKSDALTRVFDDRTRELDAPAKVLFETTGSLHWYLDEAAAPR